MAEKKLQYRRPEGQNVQYGPVNKTRLRSFSEALNLDLSRTATFFSGTNHLEVVVVWDFVYSGRTRINLLPTLSNLDHRPIV